MMANKNYAEQSDYIRYDIEFNSDRNCCVYQRTRVRWNDDGTVTAFEWQRNSATMESHGWVRYDLAAVDADDDRAVGREYFAPAGTTVRCAGVVVRPWGRDVLEIQGVAERHLAQQEPTP